jgi:hypothetical protein
MFLVKGRWWGLREAVARVTGLLSIFTNDNDLCSNCLPLFFYAQRECRPIIYGGLLTVERLATDDAIALSFTLLKSGIKKKR